MKWEKCNICEERMALIQSLKNRGFNTPEKRHNAGLKAYDPMHGPVPDTGERSRLKECCGIVVGSVTDSFERDCHHHQCVKCGRRFPEDGSYKGDWINDNLRGDDL